MIAPSFRPTGWVAEWLCSGLQSRVRRFDSDPSLHSLFHWFQEVYPEAMKSIS